MLKQGSGVIIHGVVDPADASTLRGHARLRGAKAALTNYSKGLSKR